MLKKIFTQSFIRYVIVGLVSVGIDYGTLLVGYHVLGWSLVVATTSGYAVGTVVNFLLNKFWSFNTSHTAKQTAKQAVMVAALVGFNLLATNIIILSLNAVNIGPEISKILTMGMVTLWNYVLYKKHIFKEPEPIV